VARRGRRAAVHRVRDGRTGRDRERRGARGSGQGDTGEAGGGGREVQREVVIAAAAVHDEVRLVGHVERQEAATAAVDLGHLGAGDVHDVKGLARGGVADRQGG